MRIIFLLFLYFLTTFSYSQTNENRTKEQILQRYVVKFVEKTESFNDIVSLCKIYHPILNYIPCQSPLMSEISITSNFGERRHPTVSNTTQFHSGIDLKAEYGTPLFAPANGRVKRVLLNDVKSGNAIIISHVGGYETIYAHLSEISVAAGDHVKKLQYIGKTGNSGNSTGPHLHYGIKKDGKSINPYPYLILYKIAIPNFNHGKKTDTTTK